MGSGTSKQRLGDRVLAAQKKLASDLAMQRARVKQIQATSPETLNIRVQSITTSFETCSPFSDSTLLVAFEANRGQTPKRCSG